MDLLYGPIYLQIFNLNFKFNLVKIIKGFIKEEHMISLYNSTHYEDRYIQLMSFQGYLVF